jgi:hypothetical protein
MVQRRDSIRFSGADLFWGLAAFVLLQLALAVAIEGWLPQLRDPYFAYRAACLKRQASTEPRPFLVVVLGSSRVQHGVRGADVEKRLAERIGRPVVVFNFGIPGSGPVSHWLYLRRLLKEGLKPDLLVQEIIAPLLVETDTACPAEAVNLIPDRLEPGEPADLAPYQFPAELARQWWVSWPVPWYTHRIAILSWLRPTLLPLSIRLDWAHHMDDSGYAELANAETRTVECRLRRTEQAWQEYGEPLRHFRLGRAACRAQRDILQLCRTKRIPVALLWMPEASTFRGWYPPAACSEIRSFIDGLSREFSAPFIDAREWVSDDAFSDNHHLLPEGAEIFTQRLGDEALATWLASCAGEHRLAGRSGRIDLPGPSPR